MLGAGWIAGWCWVVVGLLVAGWWWLVGGGWLVVGWWLMVGGGSCLLVVDGWWVGG